MTKSEKTRADLTTEKQNPGSINLDAMSVRAMLTFINSEDQTVAEKVADAGVSRQSGYLYYIDKNGDVARAKMARGRK